MGLKNSIAPLIGHPRTAPGSAPGPNFLPKPKESSLEKRDA